MENGIQDVKWASWWTTIALMHTGIWLNNINTVIESKDNTSDEWDTTDSTTENADDEEFIGFYINDTQPF